MWGALSDERTGLSFTVAAGPCQRSDCESQSYVTTDYQSASLSWNKALILGLRPDFYYCCWFVDVGRSLRREDGSVVCSCCWPSPEQSFSGQSCLGLATIFHCFVASYDSQGYGGGIRPRLRTGFWLRGESYVTTDGQSASLSWNKASIWGLRPDLYYCQTVACFLMWGALSDERTGLPFTIAAGPRQRSHYWVRVPRDSWPSFTVSDSRLPQPGGPGTRIYIPQEQRGTVIPPGTGFSFRRLLRLAGPRSNPPPRGYGPQTEHIFEQFLCRYLRIRCHGNACSPKTVAQQRSIPRCKGKVLSEAQPSRQSYSGFQATCHNIFPPWSI
jgi:hypothetical protein